MVGCHHQAAGTSRRDASARADRVSALVRDVPSSLRAVSQLPPFYDVDDLVRITDPTLKTATAMAIFGKSGTQLLPMLSSGAKGIEELQQQARDLGLTMATEDAQAAEAFGDRIDVLWKVLKKTVFTIGSALEPVLSAMIDSTVRIVVATSGREY